MLELSEERWGMADRRHVSLFRIDPFHHLVHPVNCYVNAMLKEERPSPVKTSNLC